VRCLPRVPAQDKFGDRLCIVDGMRIRHAADRGKAPRGRGGRPRFDRLFVFEPRFAQMDMKIHESWQDQFIAGIDDLDGVSLPLGFRHEMRSDCHNFSILDQDIGHTVDLARIDNMTALNENGHPLPPLSKYKTAMRTATPFVT
jgi:hypothetical protein